jgi:hypothetical protein
LNGIRHAVELCLEACAIFHRREYALRIGSKANIRAAKSNVRFNPESSQCNSPCLLWAKSDILLFTR